LNTLATNITTTLGALGLVGTPIIAAGTVPTEHNAFIGYIVLTGLNLAVSVSSIATGIVMRRAANKPVELQQPVLTQLKKDMATADEIAAQRRYTGRVNDKFEAKINELRADNREEMRRVFSKLDALGAAQAGHSADIAALRDTLRDLCRRVS
jgi:hypothetical protein